MTSEHQPARRSSRDVALIAIFAGVIAALGVVPAFQLPGFPVAITLQSMGVMLAGSIIGARRAFAATLLFLVLVAVGLPFLAGGRGGLGALLTPAIGFLVAWPFGAFVTGWLVEHHGSPYRLGWGILANAVGGVLVVYAAGMAGIMLVAQVSLAAAAAATWIFLPGDAAKVVVAALIARQVHRAMPDLLPSH